MLTLQITKDQVFTLIEQLSLNDQQEVLQYLVEKTREDLDDTPDDIGVYRLNHADLALTYPEAFAEQRFQPKICSC